MSTDPTILADASPKPEADGAAELSVAVGREAVDVIARTVAWVGRERGQYVGSARFVEGTLSRWVQRLLAAVPSAPADTLAASIAGFDQAEAASRAERIEQMVAALSALRPLAQSEGGEPVRRAVLLPEGIARDVPPPRAAPVVAVAPSTAPVVEFDENAARFEALVGGDGTPGSERLRGRGDRPQRGNDEARAPKSARSRDERAGQDARAPDDRPPRPDDDARARDERPLRSGEDARARDDRLSRPGEEARGRDERPQRGRRGRDGRQVEQSADSHQEIRPPDSESTPVVPAVVVEAVEPPQITQLSLGHFDGSGRGVSEIGATDAEVMLFGAAEIATIADLLLRPPASLERAGERLIDGVAPEGPVLVRGKVARRTIIFRPEGRRFELVLESERGRVVCRWLGEVPPEVRSCHRGVSLGLAGRFELGDEGQICVYEGEPLGIDGRGGDLLPAYGISGLAEPRARALVRAALRSVDGRLAEHLTPEVTERHKLLPLHIALRDAHFPSNTNRKARSRLAFDELLQVQLGLALLKTGERKDRGVAHALAHGLVSRAFGSAGWAFSDPQEAAFDALRRDLRRSAPMERLLQGDVGSGKGAVVRAAMTMVAEGKAQVLFVANSATEAEHQHVFAGEWFRSVGIEPLLLLGEPSRLEADALKKGETLVVYATRAILENPPEMRRVGLVVVEQAGGYCVPDLTPFDRGQPRPDLLVTTPTPVPSMLAMTVYGQLAMTIVDSPVCMGVDSTVVAPADRNSVYVAAAEALASGRQVILVFPPLLGMSETRKMIEVLGSAEGPLANARFALFSGAMSPQERFRAYDDFQHRRADVLFATACFEDGPVVPNASVVVVEYADTYDLVRLHRLRNHVANGWVRGKCFFVQSDAATSDGVAALDLVVRERDGFRIADMDLARRGVAAVLGADAGGVPRFAWADPDADRETLLRARAEAFRLLAADPGLKRRAHRPLFGLVRSRFGDDPAFVTDAPSVVTAAVDTSAKGRRRRRRR